jgi:hypothetical protein
VKFPDGPKDAAAGAGAATADAVWRQRGQDIHGLLDLGEGAGFTTCISRDGRRVAVGSSKGPVDADGTEQPIITRVYEYVAGSEQPWQQLGTDESLQAEAVGDRAYEVSLSTDGSILAIGASQNDGSAGELSGHVRVFHYDDAVGNWVQKGTDIDGEAGRDNSGGSISLSADGTRVAIGAIWNKGDSDDPKTGHVRVWQFDINVDDWQQIGGDLDGVAYQAYGTTVCLSADGLILAIGDGGNNRELERAVRIFSYDKDGESWEPIGTIAEEDLGSSISLSADGTIIAVGKTSYSVDDRDLYNIGRVHILQHTPTDDDLTKWTSLGYITGDQRDDALGLRGGTDLSDDGTVIVIGTQFHGSNDAGSRLGQVRICKYIGNEQWTQIGDIWTGEAAWDMVGRSVSLTGDGNTVAIAVPGRVSRGHVEIHSIVP